jgi:hypothetical protein
MHQGEQVYFVTDSTLATIADTFAVTAPPLLTLSRSSTAHRAVLDGRVALTESGRTVLSSQLDRVAACGIDQWLGGVHLQGRSGVWRWDDVRQCVTLLD